jgi:hypothetical protein
LETRKGRGFPHSHSDGDCGCQIRQNFRTRVNRTFFQILVQNPLFNNAPQVGAVLLQAQHKEISKMSKATLATYVLCPQGHLLVGRIPELPEKFVLTCDHCKETFSVSDDDVRGPELVSYDEATNR